MSGIDTRVECLDTAKSHVTKDRNSSYGEPEDNFSNIAEIWNAQGVSIDGRPLQSHDVALLMAGMKLARLRFNPGHNDSWIGMAGYAACGMHCTKVSREPVRPSVADVLVKPVPIKNINNLLCPLGGHDGCTVDIITGVTSHHMRESDVDVVKRVAAGRLVKDNPQA